VSIEGSDSRLLIALSTVSFHAVSGYHSRGVRCFFHDRWEPPRKSCVHCA
jgi:hypothetical protein